LVAHLGDSEGKGRGTVWDASRADAILAEVNKRIDTLKAQPWRTEAQQRILEVFRTVFGRYHAQRNQLLWGAPADLEHQVNVIWGTAAPRAPAGQALRTVTRPGYAQDDEGVEDTHDVFPD